MMIIIEVKSLDSKRTEGSKRDLGLHLVAFCIAFSLVLHLHLAFAFDSNSVAILFSPHDDKLGISSRLSDLFMTAQMIDLYLTLGYLGHSRSIFGIAIDI